MITHIVHLTLTDPADAAETVTRLRAMDGRIPSMLSLRAGADLGGDSAAAHVGLITTHDDLDGLQGYQVHPVHQEFVAWVGPRLASRSIADIDAGE